MKAFDSTKGLSLSERCDPSSGVMPPTEGGANKTVTCLYVIAPDRNGPVKIGIAHDPRQRARTLETYESFMVFDGFWFDSKADAEEAEYQAHKALKRDGKHVNKEWFRLTAEDASEFLEGMAEAWSDEYVARGTRCPFKIRTRKSDGREKLV